MIFTKDMDVVSPLLYQHASGGSTFDEVTIEFFRADGEGKRVSYRTDDYFFYFLALEREFLATMRGFNPERRPTPGPRADHGRWTSLADKLLEEADHLCRVAGITSHQMKRLGEAGVTTLVGLATWLIDDARAYTQASDEGHGGAHH